MSILTESNLGIPFGAFDLFRGITVTIPNDGKIRLIGPNGVGQTSLLLLLAGINGPRPARSTLPAAGGWAICARKRSKPSPTAPIPSMLKC